MVDFSPSSHRRRKCVWCTKMPPRRSVRHGMWRGHGPWHCWRWGWRDVPVGYTCLKFCEAWYTKAASNAYVYNVYIYIDIICVYMYMYIQFALVVQRYLNGAVWHFKVFQTGVSAKWHWKSVKRPMWMVAMRNGFSGCLWRAPPRP